MFPEEGWTINYTDILDYVRILAETNLNAETI